MSHLSYIDIMKIGRNGGYFLPLNSKEFFRKFLRKKIDTLTSWGPHQLEKITHNHVTYEYFCALLLS